MSTIDLQRPEYLWSLMLGFLAIIAWRVLRRRPFVAFPLATLLGSRLYRASRLRKAPTVIAATALLFIAVALADPVVPHSEGEIKSRGLDIVLVLDLSSSMQEFMSGLKDGPTRLETTKKALIDFIGRRPDDRVGLIVFSDYAYLVSPLTLDHRYLSQYVSKIDADTLRDEGLTAIGDGIALGNTLLTRQKIARSSGNQVMVIFTDGEHNYGADPINTLADTDAAGIRAHMVLVDLDEVVRQRPAVLRLVETVRGYGGRSFDADTATELQEASIAIGKLEKGWLVQTRYLRNRPVYHYFTAPAIVLLACAFLLRAVPYFIDVT